MQRLKQFLILGKPTPRLIHRRRECTLLFFGLFEVDLGDLDPAKLGLVIGQPV